METGSGSSADSTDIARSRELLTRALELEPSARAAYLEQACRDDPHMLHEVLSLLEAHEHTGPLDQLGGALRRAMEAEGPEYASSADPVRTDSSVGRYHILETVGRGGMGVVYRARDDRLDREVALKFLTPDLSRNPGWRDRFLAEARAAAALEHPNICTVHEIGETDNGLLFIAMPLYTGRPLESMIDQGALPVPQALEIALQVCSGLKKAHDNGIVHGDIKPANLLMTADGTVKILDFGVARFTAAHDDHKSPGAGTAPYMSPGRTAGNEVDPRSDLWSLGVVLYRMITGRRPFDGSSKTELRTAILQREPIPPTEVRSGLRPSVDRILDRALAKDPQLRYQSAADFADALLVEISERSPRGHTRRPANGDKESAADPPGAAASELIPPGGEHRHVTVLAIAIDRSVPGVRRAIEGAATRHGGIPNWSATGPPLVVFGIPVTHEDDAARAVRAARELDSTIRAELSGESAASQLAPRFGIATGRVLATRDDEEAAGARVTGDIVGVARRLSRVARPGDVRLSDPTSRLVEPFFRIEPVDPPGALGDSGEAAESTWIAGDPTPFEGRLDAAAPGSLTPFSGRGRELQLLRDRLQRVLAGDGQLVYLAGEAGAGKSRLLLEFEQSLEEGEFHVLHGSCRSYGGRSPYLPFREALIELLGPGGEDTPELRAEKVAREIRAISSDLEDVIPLCIHLLSLPGSGHPLPDHLRGEHLRAAMVDALSATFTLASLRRPVVLLLEDWHAADHASASVLERLRELVPGYPLLVAATYRPGHGVHPTDDPVTTPLRLRPLEPEESEAAMRWLFGAESISGELSSTVRGRAGGNPFFLEELCRALRQSGGVRVEDGRAKLEATRIAGELPETVQGVVRARLDRLDPNVRHTLRIASVFGREFRVPELLELVPDRGRLEYQLDMLTRQSLVQPVRIFPERTYRFQHALTREVAYDSLVKAQRRQLHARIGELLEADHGKRPGDALEELAHHFGQAGEWEKAAEYAWKAGDRAAGLSEFKQALEFFESAERWLRKLPRTRDYEDRITTVLLRQERICETLGLRARQQKIIELLFARLAAASHERRPDPRLADVYLRQGDIHTLAGRFEDAARALSVPLKASRAQGDRVLERNIRRSIGLLRWHQGRDAAAVKQVERALAIDYERNAMEAVAGDLANLGNLLRGRGDLDRALKCLEEALGLAEEQENPLRQSYVLHSMGNVFRAAGDVEAALHHFERARSRAAGNRLAIPHSFNLTAIAHLQLRQGEIEQSLSTYQEAVEVARAARHAEGLSQALRILGSVLCGLGRGAEALPPLEESAELFGLLEDPRGEADARSKAAEVREAAGENEQALEIWQRVHALRKRSDDRVGELIAAEGIARATRALGAAESAIECYRRSAALARTLDRPAREASLRNTIGILEWERGAHAAALREFEHALDALTRAKDPAGRGLILNSLGVTLCSMGRPRDAIRSLRQAAASNREHGREQWLAYGLAAQADAYGAIGDRDAARECLEDSLALRRKLGDRTGEGWMLHDLARLAFEAGEERSAHRLLRKATAIAEECSASELVEACQRLPAH